MTKKILKRRILSPAIMKQTPLVVLDLETTGLSPYKHQITEIAAAKVVDGEIIDTFETLVNPRTPIPRFITRLTGITDEMVKDKPTVEQVLPEFQKFLKDHPIVAHNASFDVKFLKHNLFRHCGERLQNSTVCTAKLARRILRELPSKKLENLCRYYGITNTQAHRAYGDVEATVNVLNKMTEMLNETGIKTFEQVRQFQTLPISKASQLFSDTDNL